MLSNVFICYFGSIWNISFILTCRTAAPGLVPGGMRTTRSWKVRIPPAASSPLHRSLFSALPSFSRTPRASEARTRAKLRGNGCFFDRGGWAARSERRAAWVCNVRHVGHGVLNRGGTAEPSNWETEKERPRPGARPALFALLRT